jgi:hypothetical protein
VVRLATHTPEHEPPVDEAAYQADLALLDTMMNQVKRGSEKEAEYLALLDRLEQYESAHFPM